MDVLLLAESFDIEIINQFLQNAEVQRLITWVLAIFSGGTLSITLFTALIYRFIKKRSAAKIASEIVKPVVDLLKKVVGEDNAKLLQNVVTNTFNKYGTRGIIDKLSEFIVFIPALRQYILLDLEKNLALGTFDLEGMEEAKVVAETLKESLSNEA